MGDPSANRKEEDMMSLKVDDLEVFYGNAKAINGVSFEVAKGDFVSFVGANGAGKSTILDSISNLTNWYGKIMFDGIDLSRFSPSKIVGLGVIQAPERRNLFPFMTVKENLLMGAYLSRSTVKENFEFVFKLFPVLKEREGQKARTLSGGEQRMLALGKALMSNPKLLMLDEPTLGLAPLLVEHLSKTIAKLREEGLTILLMEQSVNLAFRHSKKIYILEMGEVVTSGSPNELQSEDSVTRVYFPHKGSPRY